MLSSNLLPKSVPGKSVITGIEDRDFTGYQARAG